MCVCVGGVERVFLHGCVEVYTRSGCDILVNVNAFATDLLPFRSHARQRRTSRGCFSPRRPTGHLLINQRGRGLCSGESAAENSVCVQFHQYASSITPKPREGGLRGGPWVG